MNTAFKLEEEISPIETEALPWCDEHDQEFKVLWLGEPPMCEACFVYEMTGYAYDCDRHGPHNGSCSGCDREDWNHDY